MILNNDIVINYPFFGLVVSLILFFGLYQLGDFIFKNLIIKNIFSKISEIKYQNILIAVNFLAAILFPIVLYFKYSTYLIVLVAYILFVLGTIRIYLIYKNFNYLKNINLKKISFEKYIFGLLIIGFFFIGLGPVNHSDSLDYHVSVAQYILSEGKFPNTINNPHHLLAGAGEVIMSIGYVFAAEQFGTLIQFSGLISLIGIFKKFSKKEYIYVLLAISSPIILFLVSSPKPQLLPLCTNAVVFSLFFFNPEKIYKKDKEIYYLIPIGLIFLINSINMKFSFILSSSILSFYIIKLIYKKKIIKEALLLIFLSLSTFYLPTIYWKYLNFGGNFFEYLINPIPTHIAGMENFKSYLTNFQRQSSFIYAFFPKNFKEITGAIGLGTFSVLFLYKLKRKKFETLIIISFFVMITFLFGQPSGRFFLEPYFWMLIIFAKLEHNHIHKYLRYLFSFQFIGTIVAIYFGVFTLSVGSINSKLRDKVMSKSANGYSLYKWGNSEINENDNFISMHRSVSLGNNRAISTTFLFYLEEYHDYNDKLIYIEQIEKSNPKYILSFMNIESLDFFNNCISGLHLTKKNVGNHAARNPFNRGGYYDGHIYKLKEVKLSECLK